MKKEIINTDKKPAININTNKADNKKFVFNFGAHLSLAAPDYIEDLILRCALSAIQIFISNPRSFNPVFSIKSRRNLNALKNKYPHLFICVHMPYVVNLASNDESLRAKSVEHVCDALRAAAEIGAAHYVVHPGSGPYDNFLDSFDKIIGSSLALPVSLLIENTEGSGNKLMGGVGQMIDFIDKFGGEARFCWDTAHAFGAGVDTLKMPAALKSAVKLIHLNDSKVDFGSKKDRHDSFFTGAIGIETIGLIIKTFKACAPFIIEREGHEATFSDLTYIATFLN